MRDKDRGYYAGEMKRRLTGWSMRVDKATLDDIEDLEEQLVKHYRWMVTHMPCNHMPCFTEVIGSFSFCTKGLNSKREELVIEEAQQHKPEPKRRKNKKLAHPEWSLPDSPYRVQ